jgi:hypothetical protein
VTLSRPPASPPSHMPSTRPQKPSRTCDVSDLNPGCNPKPIGAQPNLTHLSSTNISATAKPATGPPTHPSPIPDRSPGSTSCFHKRAECKGAMHSSQPPNDLAKSQPRARPALRQLLALQSDWQPLTSHAPTTPQNPPRPAPHPPRALPPASPERTPQPTRPCPPTSLPRHRK